MDPKSILRRIKQRYRAIWKEQDVQQMSLHAVDHICTCVEDGMDPKKALELIYKFSHCALKNTCYSSHSDWREELKEFYRKTFIDK